MLSQNVMFEWFGPSIPPDILIITQVPDNLDFTNQTLPILSQPATTIQPRRSRYRPILR